MAGKDDDWQVERALPNGEGLLINGKKSLDPVQIPIHAFDPGTGLAYIVADYPLDRDVARIYQSKAGGFVSPYAGGDTCFSQMHYGEGFFEGMRYYYSPYGVVMPRPWMNYARFLHSATVFNPKLAKIVAEYFGIHTDLQKMHMGIPLTPKAYYDLAESLYQDGKKMSYPLVLEYGDGRIEELQVDMAMQVAGKDGMMELDMRKMDTIVKVLAYTGRLVSIDHFPGSLEMIQAGYARPWGWVSGEMGLKVPSITIVKENGSRVIKNKPLYFACATLPWGLYLTENDYQKGLDVMVSPYLRIMDDTMPSNAKVAANYVNSALAINMGVMFGFGEILAFNRDGRFVEGSAENAFVIMDEGGKLVAYTPPIGGGCLPGTTRDGVIRAIESLGLEVRYKALGLDALMESKAILLTGTGAQMIHVRSITEFNATKKIADAVRLQTEGNEYPQDSVIVRDDFKRTENLINSGTKHDIVAKIQSAYKDMLLSRRGMLEPVYNVDFETLGELLKIDLKDFTSKKERAEIRSGYFGEMVNGIKAPDELAEKNRKCARLISRALKMAPEPGIPIKNLLRHR